MIFLFISIILMNYFNRLHNTEPILHYRNKLCLVMIIKLLVCFWVIFGKFALIFINEIDMSFSFCALCKFLVNGVFWWTKFLNFHEFLIYLFVFWLLFFCLIHLFIFPISKLQRYVPMPSFRSLIVLVLTCHLCSTQINFCIKCSMCWYEIIRNKYVGLCPQFLTQGS